MPRYSSFGALDDQLVDDADLGFVSMNNRLRPDQLKAGILANSQNGRMGINGEWQTRKGIDLVVAPIAAGGTALTLPFYLYAQKSVNTASRSGSTVTVTFSSAHGFIDNTLVYFSGFTGFTAGQDPNGNRLITVVNSTTLTFTMTGSATVTYTGTKFAGSPILDDTAVNAIYGSCLYSNPNDSTKAYIIVASNTKAIAVKLFNDNTGIKSINIDYPAGETVSQNVSMLQAFNKVFIFRDGDAGLEWDGDLTTPSDFTLIPSGDYTQPVLIANSNNTAIINGLATVETNTAHDLEVGDPVTVIDGDSIITDGQVVIVSAVPDSTSFNYYITENGASAPNVITAADKASGSGIVTITTADEHGHTTGDHIKITGLTGFTGTDPNGTWPITVVDLDTFTYDIGGHGHSQAYTETGALATLASSIEYMRRQSVGLGFCYMPAPPWAVYHQRRLWMPFNYQQASAGSTSFVSRGVKDQLIVSDILDSDTYDQVYNQYRFNAGTADYIVALLPFADDKLIVFNRNSIHIIISQADITQSSVQLLTNEVGCLARKTVIQVANNILFLSDNGIYGANFQDLYNLRGNGIPLSDSIQATINRINKSYAQNAVAAYFDNRYYIAVPLDGSSTNNTVLVYNFLNQGWESIDTVRNDDGSIDPNWNITDLFVGGEGADRGLYSVSNNGGIHRLDFRADSDDIVVTQIGGNSEVKYIRSACTTRMFTYGTTDRKKFNNFELQVESEPTLTSDVTITAEGENVDSVLDLGTVAERLGGVLDANEDASIRGRIGQPRSYGLQFTFTPTLGRPRIRTIKVSASVTNRAITSAK
jgi:hypothetical protein